MEEIKEVKTVMVHYKCDKCEKGYMVTVNGKILTTYPAQYPHKCNVCGCEKHFIKTYPHLSYEEVK